MYCYPYSRGVIIPGGFGSRGIEGKVAAAQFCRERNVPMLGVCLGLQVAVIEFARNVLGWKGEGGAHTYTSTNIARDAFRDGQRSSPFVLSLKYSTHLILYLPPYYL